MTETTQPLPTTSEPNRLFWCDLVRAWAIAMVVLLHASGQVTTLYGQIPGITWGTANVIHAVTRSCVPLFFMLTGFLIFSSRSRYSIGDYLKKRVTRILYPLIFFSFLYTVLHHLAWGYPLDWGQFLREPTRFHLWFFYFLFSIYLMAAVARPVEGDPVWLATVSVLFLALGSSWYKGAGIDSYFMQVCSLAGYFLYALIGYYLGQLSIHGRNITVAAIAFIASTAAIAVLGYSASFAAGKSVTHFGGYLSPQVLCQAVALFLLAKPLSARLEKSPVVRRTVRFVSKYSLGIYGFQAAFLTLTNMSLKLLGISPPLLLKMGLIFTGGFGGALFVAALIGRIDRKGRLV